MLFSDMELFLNYLLFYYFRITKLKKFKHLLFALVVLDYSYKIVQCFYSKLEYSLRCSCNINALRVHKEKKNTSISCFPWTVLYVGAFKKYLILIYIIQGFHKSGDMEFRTKYYIISHIIHRN